MSLVLSLETSTSICSVALHKEHELIACYELFLEKSHAENSTQLIDHILYTTGFDKKQLDAIAISKGPGSYTGLRIGTATAKGLCLALNIPLIAVPTLTAMAHQVNLFNTEHYLLCPMIDARRMEVYCAIYDHSLNSIRETAAEILDEKSFHEILEKHTVLFFGNGAEKFNSFSTYPSTKIIVNGIHPSAKNIGALAFPKFQQKQFEDLAYFEPFYLKEFIGKKSFSS